MSHPSNSPSLGSPRTPPQSTAWCARTLPSLYMKSVLKLFGRLHLTERSPPSRTSSAPLGPPRPPSDPLVWTTSRPTGAPPGPSQAPLGLISYPSTISSPVCPPLGPPRVDHFEAELVQ
eukprot:652050-Prorocentrum_minimum.AAC.2